MNSDYQPGMLSPIEQQRIQRDITPGGQVERAAQAIHVQREQRALVDAFITRLQSSAGQRLLQQTIERTQRRPAYAGVPSGMITRSPAPLATMRADLDALKRRGAAIERQVARERRGY